MSFVHRLPARKWIMVILSTSTGLYSFKELYKHELINLKVQRQEDWSAIMILAQWCASFNFLFSHFLWEFKPDESHRGNLWIPEHPAQLLSCSISKQTCFTVNPRFNFLHLSHPLCKSQESIVFLIISPLSIHLEVPFPAEDLAEIPFRVHQPVTSLLYREKAS